MTPPGGSLTLGTPLSSTPVVASVAPLAATTVKPPAAFGGLGGATTTAVVAPTMGGFGE